MTVSPHDALPGDLVVVSGHHQGEPERLGEILEVRKEDATTSFVVRWEDEHESVFFPGSDAHVRPSSKRIAGA
jgi:hypothetical protein